MKMLLAGLLAMSFTAVGAPVAAQVQEKSAPEDAQFALATAHRVAMTHARRVENAEASEKDDAIREIGVLVDAMDAVMGAVDAVAKSAGPEYAAQIEAMRKYDEAAKKHVDALKGMQDRPVSAAAKAEAAGAREQLDLADTAQQKLMKAIAAPKPEPVKPAVPPT